MKKMIVAFMFLVACGESPMESEMMEETSDIPQPIVLCYFNYPGSPTVEIPVPLDHVKEFEVTPYIQCEDFEWNL